MIIAIGATALVPPIMGLADMPFLTNETLFDLTSLPRSLAILGGGPIGSEIAQAFARLGAAVTLVEALDRVLPPEEPEVSPVITGSLVADGVEIRTGSGVIAVESAPGGVRLLFGDESAPAEAAHLLVAIGRAPSGRGLGLEEVGVEVDGRGAVVADDTLRTAVGNIWAIGDVTARLPFTHVATKMALRRGGAVLIGRAATRSRDRHRCLHALLVVQRHMASDQDGPRVVERRGDRVGRAGLDGDDALGAGVFHPLHVAVAAGRGALHLLGVVRLGLLVTHESFVIDRALVRELEGHRLPLLHRHLTRLVPVVEHRDLDDPGIVDRSRGVAVGTTGSHQGCQRQRADPLAHLRLLGSCGGVAGEVEAIKGHARVSPHSCRKHGRGSVPGMIVAEGDDETRGRTR